MAEEARKRESIRGWGREASRLGEGGIQAGEGQRD